VLTAHSRVCCCSRAEQATTQPTVVLGSPPVC
jgi:hypothetical protein